MTNRSRLHFVQQSHHFIQDGGIVDCDTQLLDYLCNQKQV